MAAEPFDFDFDSSGRPKPRLPQESQVKKPPPPKQPPRPGFGANNEAQKEPVKRPAPHKPAPPAASRPAASLWFLTTPKNESFGPVPKPELDKWFAQGLITADCQILREGDDQWLWASEVYPQLADPATTRDVPQSKFCHECGERIRSKAEICPKCGVRQPADFIVPEQSQQYIRARTGASKDKVAAGICGILLGCFGVHKFILGYTTPGIIMLLVCILGACLYGLGPLVMAVIGIIEGIIYLTMSDADFDRAHTKHGRPWF